MKHNHKEECKHEKLTYCKECDVVECECGREWGKKEEIPVPQPYGVNSWCYNCNSWYSLSTNPHICQPMVWVESHEQRIDGTGKLYKLPTKR